MKVLALTALMLGIAVAATGSLMPIRGDNINGTREDVSCGPALFTVAHWTEPAKPDRFIPGQPGGHIGVSARAWCEGEAGTWMMPSYAVAAVILAVGGILGLLHWVGRRRATATDEHEQELVPRG
jgi:hypothetical protein